VTKASGFAVCYPLGFGIGDLVVHELALQVTFGACGQQVGVLGDPIGVGCRQRAGLAKACATSSSLSRTLQVLDRSGQEGSSLGLTLRRRAHRSFIFRQCQKCGEKLQPCLYVNIEIQNSSSR